ncbi:coenzyme F420-reducing hydrogenase, alpha subunit [Frankia casuarinae]|uniref:Nickel-dependent hydrogenase, large subunit n=1 Tax=Frankia casuarinae (strain DSM 45818 / CECT 9043 / HFP020203 / CcI3) TaxID=106370 RepID=Q2J4F0_FRACC|nr:MULTISPECIES: Ni/Fe hydrogenase subunit alpha [Frankia]ABD13842.1 nickel-dependent hydrogenase, large subunit [Frankia casuarinae]EYT94260.1 coenzyme F420-reducing hydrogenase, alpha subunit [Frankia casuarinae]KDA44219.1 coenzyme F420-reducing hydrogenase, alpha subunit [Frankia sp. BMG5.23]
MRATRTIAPPPLTRVEGEGRLLIKITDGRVDEAHLKIFEPPRFFEAFLRGRAYTEPPDITARICGICPVAYQMSALAAIEQICDVTVTGPPAALRRLIYCGEWIESHALHVFLLHLPDFLGYDSALHLAQDQPALVKLGLTLKKAGNTLMTVIGGRAIHPVNARVGGWYRAPRRRDLTELVGQLEQARDIARDTARFTAALDFPEDELHQTFVALHQPGEYPVERGRIASTAGLDIAPADYDRHFTEEQVPWSNALHSTLAAGGSYLTGPLARFALGAERLAPAARETAAEIGLRPPERNPYRSIIVRCIEMVHAADEALRIIADYTEPDPSALEAPPRAGTGYGVTEAPRGLLYHRYTIDHNGTILDAKIVPPTAQNQRPIEEDLRGVVERFMNLSEPELALRCERAIRNYDPCISCATHFLTLHIEHG